MRRTPRKTPSAMGRAGASRPPRNARAPQVRPAPEPWSPPRARALTGRLGLSHHSSGAPGPPIRRVRGLAPPKVLPCLLGAGGTRRGMDCIPSDIDFLDRGAGGFFRGKPYLVFGASGTGKSILGLQFANAGLERGEAALYVCRERAQDLVDQAERLGFPLSQRILEERLSVLEYDADFRDIAARQGPEALFEELR